MSIGPSTLKGVSMDLLLALISEAYYRRLNTWDGTHRPMLDSFNVTHTYYHRGGLPMVVRTHPVIDY